MRYENAGGRAHHHLHRCSAPRVHRHRARQSIRAERVITRGIASAARLTSSQASGGKDFRGYTAVSSPFSPACTTRCNCRHSIRPVEALSRVRLRCIISASTSAVREGSSGKHQGSKLTQYFLGRTLFRPQFALDCHFPHRRKHGDERTCKRRGMGAGGRCPEFKRSIYPTVSTGQGCARPAREETAKWFVDPAFRFHASVPWV